MGHVPLAVPGWITLERFGHDQRRRWPAEAYPVEAVDGTVTGLLTVDQVDDVALDLRARTRVDTVATPIDRVATARPDQTLGDLADLDVPADGWVLVLDGKRAVGLVPAKAIPTNRARC
jgi:hypothetical protein